MKMLLSQKSTGLIKLILTERKIRLLTCQNESIINFNGMVYTQFEREKRSTIKNHEQRLGVYDVDIYGTHIFV